MITVEHLSKYYGDHLAVDDLSFTINNGHIYGFLGPNGAGKSTTMNILTGCLSLSEGSVKIDDYDIFEEPEKGKKMIGYLPEIPPLYPDETAYEYLSFVAEAKGIKKENIKADVNNVIEKCQLEAVKDRLIKFLSKGYRQRVGIAEALLGNPEIIILDEPTVGLDPAQIIEIRDLIKSLGKDHTVILSSHILSEVKTLCDKVMIINKGKLVGFDSPENLEKLFIGQSTIELIVEGAQKKIEKQLKCIGNIKDYSIEKCNKKYKLTINLLDNDDESACHDIFLSFAKNNMIIYQMKTNNVSLEDIFMELTKDEKGENYVSSVEA